MCFPSMQPGIHEKLGKRFVVLYLGTTNRECQEFKSFHTCGPSCSFLQRYVK